MWIVPTELTQALRGIGNALGGSEDGSGTWEPGDDSGAADELAAMRLEDPREALSRAQAEAAGAVADAEGAARVASPEPTVGDVPPPAGTRSPDGPPPGPSVDRE
jgi:hypothetical protein